MTTISSGQTSTVTTSTTTAYTVLAGGTLVVSGSSASVNNAVVSGGIISLAKGSVSNTVVDGGQLYVSGGNTVSGSTTVADGGSVEFATSGGVLNGSLTFGAGGGELVLDKTISQAGLNNATLSGFAAGDLIEIAGGYTAETLTTTVSGGVTSVTFAATSGAAAETQTFVVSGALNNSFDLLATTISTVSVGKTSGVEILLGQGVTVSSGATLYVYGGGSASATTVDSGGALLLSGTASDTTVVGGGTVELATAAATLTGTLNFASGHNDLLVSALASSGAGDQAVISGFQTGDVVDVAAIASSGASLAFTTSGGNEVVTVSNGGSSESFVFAGTSAYTANTLVLSADTNGGAEIELAAGGVTISVTTSTSSGAYDVTSGNTLLVLSGGSVSEAKVENGAFLTVDGGADTAATVSAGGTLTVESGSASGDQIYGSGVETGGAVTGETVFSGGALTVSGGVETSGTIKAGASEVVKAGGSATGDAIYGALTVSGGSVTGEVVEAGGSATLNAGAVDSGMVVSAGGTLTVSAATGSATLSGDKIYGVVNTVSGLAATFTNETICSGGVFNLYNSNEADDTVVSAGGLLLLSGHEVATDTTLIGSGTLELDSPKATLSGSLTFSGVNNTLLITDKLASAGYGTLATISGFTADDQIIIASGLATTISTTSSGGELSVTLSGSGADETLVFAGGNYTASEVSFTTLANGDDELLIAIPTTNTVSTVTSPGAYTLRDGVTLDVVSGGVVSATTVEGGATLAVNGGDDNAATIQKGGEFVVLAGSATGDTISGSGVVSGGAVTSETVASGGSLTLDGGVADDIVLGGGATLDLASASATLSGSLTFENGHNTFDVSAGANPGGVTISGYRSDDKIEVSSFTYSGTSATFTSNGNGTETVVVANGGQTETFNFASAAADNSTTLALAPDGSNVDLVLKSAPTIAFTTLDDLTTNQSSYVVHGTVAVNTDPYAIGQTVSIVDNGAVAGTGVVQADGYWAATVTLADDNGANALSASVTDSAGSSATTAKGVTLTADTSAPAFTKGDLVISISGDGDGSGAYGDNQASPITLEQITTAGTIVSQLVLPETKTTVDGVTEDVISGEYGSSSEGTLQLSADGHSLVIAGYGVDDATYNAGGAAVYGNAALAQSTSIPEGEPGNSSYEAIPRVIADIGADGVVDDSTALYNVFNTNNPRSVATVDGSTFYVSGQGDKNETSPDQGVFSAQSGATTATPINTTTDARDVGIYDDGLYASVDSTQGAGTGDDGIYYFGQLSDINSGVELPGMTGSFTLTAADANSVNQADIGQTVYQSPENFYFADDTTLYIADSGAPKQGALGDGGLQKWSLIDGAWHLDYTLSAGLTLISNATTGATNGDTGLIGLTGEVNADTGMVTLYATTEPLNDLGATSVVAIDDALNATSETGESFTTILTASPGENIRGVAFAPTPCFCTGVQILTPGGEVAVEALRVGDEVVTASGGRRRIKWIGRRALDLSRHPAPEKVWPVRLRRDSFAPGLPKRDLWLSPDHNLAFEGSLIRAGALINGRSVEQVRAERVVYWHVELDAHDILISDGLPTESYLDTGNRSGFENGGTFVEAHPDFGPRHWADTCLPLALEGPAVAAAKARLLANLAAAGHEVDREADAHILVDGLRVEPIRLSETRLAFALPASGREIVLRSRTFVPAHSLARSDDPRSLGLCVGALQIDGSTVALPHDEAGASGWREAEYDGGAFTHRWTTGSTPLPAGARLVIVDLAGFGHYWRGAEDAIASRSGLAAC
jgi:autotransporter passenger strand-loop-strand repeat protein